MAATAQLGSRVFIGHGGSHQWRELKDYVQDQLGVPVDEFNRVPTAGHATVARFGEMLDSAAMAFLVMTAEDETPEGDQEVLPFTRLNDPTGVAVDSAGNVYVTDWGDRWVVKMPAGSSSQEVLPFTDLDQPENVAVDPAGPLYVTDRVNNRVVKLAAGASTPEVLPFPGLNNPSGVAVGPGGDVYVTDYGAPNGW